VDEAKIIRAPVSLNESVAGALFIISKGAVKLSKLLLMIAIFLLALLLIASCGGTPPATTPITTPSTTSTLDQSQTSIPGNTGLEGDWWLSQGFVPYKPLMTAVEVYIGSVHANLSYPLSLQIRSDDNGLPSSSILTSTSFTSSQEAWGWITFDIPDIEVAPGTKYHLVLSSASNYHTGLDSTNPYPGGYMCYSTDAGKTWGILNDSQNYDMAFKIHGSAPHTTTPPITTTPPVTTTTPPVTTSAPQPITTATPTTPTPTITTPSTTTTQTFNGTGKWSGTIEGYWTNTYYYPVDVDIIGGGINQLTYNYSISLSIDVKEDGTFSGTAQFNLEQPIWVAQVLSISENGNIITLIEYRAEISPTEFVVPVTGNFPEAGVVNFYFADIPERHQTYFYTTVDSLGARDEWQHSFDTWAIPHWNKQFSYTILSENAVSLAHQASDEDSSGSVPSSYFEEATGTLYRER
jgi:hypothetical protein